MTPANDALTSAPSKGSSLKQISRCPKTILKTLMLRPSLIMVSHSSTSTSFPLQHLILLLNNSIDTPTSMAVSARRYFHNSLQGTTSYTDRIKRVPRSRPNRELSFLLLKSNPNNDGRMINSVHHPLKSIISEIFRKHITPMTINVIPMKSLFFKQ